MCRRELVTLRKLSDFIRGERTQQILGQLAQEGIAQTVDPLEVFEQQNQALEVRRLELAVDAVERMSDGMSDPGRLEITLENKNVVAGNLDVGMLRFGNAPGRNVTLGRGLGEKGRVLFANKRVGEILNLETTGDRVVIGQ